MSKPGLPFILLFIAASIQGAPGTAGSPAPPESGADRNASVGLTSSNLPIIVIDTRGQSIPDEPKIPADMGVISNGDGMRNRLTDPYNHYSGPIGIEIRGNVTQSFPKKPYYVETRDGAGNNLNVSLLGLPPENDWILLAAFIDKTLLRDALAFRMSRLAGRWAPRTVFCELVVNGEYLGVYILTERIKPDGNRLNISRMDATDLSGDAVTGGYVYQVSQEEPTFGARRGFVYPKAQDIRPEQTAYLRGYDDGFRAVMSRAGFDDPRTGYPAWIDADCFIDEILVQETCKNSDAYGWSSYFHKDRLGRLRAGPVWDFDQAFSNSTFNDGPNATEWIIEKSQTDAYLKSVYPGFWLRLFRETEFRNRLIRRWRSLREGPFRTDSLLQFVDATAARLNEAQARNFQKWPILGQEIWRSTPGWRERNTYGKEIDYLKGFLVRRLDWMDGRLREGPPDGGEWVAYYPFDEGRGDVAFDHSGNGLHGTLAGGAEWTAGRRGGGLEFNGTDAYVDCGQSSEFDISERITLAAWVLPLDVADGRDHEWVSKGDYAWALKEKGAGAFQFFVFGETWHVLDVALDPGLHNGVWTHFAGTFDGREIKSYVNGDVAASAAHAGPIAVTDAPVTLGNNSQVPGRFFRGVLDDAVIYGRALDSAEIKALYEMGPEAAVRGKIPPDAGRFRLQQSYPNPFNPSATIRYTMTAREWVTLKIYDPRGREIRTLVDEDRPAGDHSAVFDAAGLPGGVYVCVLRVKNRFSETKKMVLVR